MKVVALPPNARAFYFDKEQKVWVLLTVTNGKKRNHSRLHFLFPSDLSLQLERVLKEIEEGKVEEV